MTVLEARVNESRWDELVSIYRERVRGLPPGLLQTYLVQGRSEGDLWRIISVWESPEALERMRASGETPAGVLMFRAAGAEPQLGLFRIRLDKSS